jgi:uncharacterized membrane protein YhiD involved in acid resistance
MNIKQFEKMLDAQGSDISKWNDNDREEAKELIASSNEAATLHKEAESMDKALNSFVVESPDDTIIENVMNNIQNKNNTAQIHKVKQEKKKTVIWYGSALAAAAATIILFIALNGHNPAERFYNSSNNRNIVIAENLTVESFISEFDVMIEEEIEQQEIIGMWQMADNKNDPADIENEIEQLVNEIITDTEDIKSIEEMDLWELLLQSETKEL